MSEFDPNLSELIFVSPRDRTALLGLPGSLSRLENGEVVGRDMERRLKDEEWRAKRDAEDAAAELEGGE